VEASGSIFKTINEPSAAGRKALSKAKEVLSQQAAGN